MEEQCQLKSFTFERQGAPVMLAFSIYSGSQLDPIGKSGLTHFLEHMLVSGTRSLPSKDLLSAHIEDLGGTIGAYTEYESITIHLELGDASDIEEGIRTLAEMYQSSLLNINTIEKERGAILSELRIKESKPDQMAIATLHCLMYENTPLGRFILGSKEDIERISLGDITEYLENNIAHAPQILVAAGGVSSSKIKQLTDKYFHTNKLQPYIFEEFGKIAPNKDKVQMHNFPGTEEVVIAMGIHTSGLLSKETPALLLAAQILGGGRSSLLMKKLRYKNGLVYSVIAEQHSGRSTGEFIIRTSAKPTEVWRVIDLIKHEISNLINGGISEIEFNSAKERYVKSRKIRMQTSRSWAFNHIFGLLCDSNYKIENEDLKVMNLQYHEFIAYITKFLKSNNQFISLVGGTDKIPNVYQ